MIYAVFGMPGSGKSYYVVNEFIVKRISTNTIISNIKLSDDIEIPENYRYLEKKDMDNLHINFRNIMDDKSTSHDDKKQKLAFLLGLYGDGDITVIVDECHLYGYRGRSSQISYIDDLLSIHRHIFTDRKVDFILITQVPSRLNTEIAAQVEIAVSAIPASQRVITSMLEYSVYGSVDALKKQDKLMRMKRQIIKGDPKVFSMYQSGFVLKGSNDFRKKLLGMVAGIVLVISYVGYQFFGLTHKKHTLATKDIISSPVIADKGNNDSNISKVNAAVLLSNYRIVCRSVPVGFDVKKVKDYFYSILNGEELTVCYRVFERVKNV